MSEVDLSEGIDVVRLGGNIGAEIHGLDLRKSISNDQFKVLQDAFYKYEVLVFRDQDITLDEQIAFDVKRRLRIEHARVQNLCPRANGVSFGVCITFYLAAPNL